MLIGLICNLKVYQTISGIFFFFNELDFFCLLDISGFEYSYLFYHDFSAVRATVICISFDINSSHRRYTLRINPVSICLHQQLRFSHFINICYDTPNNNAHYPSSVVSWLKTQPGMKWQHHAMSFVCCWHHCAWSERETIMANSAGITGRISESHTWYVSDNCFATTPYLSSRL